MQAPLLHVLGAGPWQVATVRRARSLGYRVLVTDGSADRPACAEADFHAVADITDPEATLTVARRHAIDGVLCDTTDNGVVAAAYVAQELSLPGPGLEAALNCTDKARMTACARAAGLRVPQSEKAGSPEQALAALGRLSVPCVVKPVDNQSGRGVSIVRAESDFDAAIALAFSSSRLRQLLVQEWVAGVELIVDAIVCDGAVHCLGIATKVAAADNPTVATRITYGSLVLPISPVLIIETNARLVQALGVRQGLVHAEYLVHGGVPVPIDVAARGGGVHIYPVVLPHVSGVDAMRAAIDLALGRPCSLQPHPVPRAANIEFLRAPSGRIVAIDGLDIARAVPGVALLHLNLQVGDRSGVWLDKEQRLGHVITLAEIAEDAMAAGARAAKALQVRVE